MTTTDTNDVPPLSSVDELVAEFQSACKPAAQWRVGTESEMIGAYAEPPELGKAPPYEGDRGIGALLSRIAEAGWSPVRENGNAIALASGDTQITLEPGGQLELAARPVDAAADTEAYLLAYERVVADASRDLGIAWLGLGFRPLGGLEDVPWMPKRRYSIMREYLPTRGKLAHEMMKRTSTVQVNLDFADAGGAAEKLRAAMSVTSIMTAIYANSPIVDGALSDYQSYRAHVWHHTDPDRCGLLRFAFEDGDIFRAYAEYALDVPMFFVHRGDYLPVGGMTFRQFMAEGFDGARATMEDWELHLSTLFPEARIKRFMEIRGCDGGTRDMVLALAPLCRGLFYDADARASATALTAGLDFDQRQTLSEDVARRGLRAGAGAHAVGELAKQLVAIADDGLGRTAPSERRYLEPLREIVETGRTRADIAADAWRAADGDPIAAIRCFRRFA